MKKALTSGIMSFILIYATCILFGPANQDLAKKHLPIPLLVFAS